jgi:hypothetical protein
MTRRASEFQRGRGVVYRAPLGSLLEIYCRASPGSAARRSSNADCARGEALYAPLNRLVDRQSTRQGRQGGKKTARTRERGARFLPKDGPEFRYLSQTIDRRLSRGYTRRRRQGEETGAGHRMKVSFPRRLKIYSARRITEIMSSESNFAACLSLERLL